MKVCLISNLYPPFDRGGAEQVVVKTATGLVAAGHQVVIITSTPGAPAIEQQENIKIYRLHPSNLFFYTAAHEHGSLARLLWHVIDMFQWSAAREVTQIIRAEKPAVVHTHNLMGLSFLIPRALRRLGVRHVHTVHDVQLVEPSAMILASAATSWRYTGWLSQGYTALMRWLLGSPAVVFSSTQFLLDFYTERGFFLQSKKIKVRNPVELMTATETVPKAASPMVRFLYLGQMEIHKGVLELVRAFLLVPKTVATELHLLGSGSLLEEIRQAALVDDRIVVHGRVEHSWVVQWLGSTDVTIVPSLCYENSPTALMESLANGVPVIASNVEGIAEMISDGENGFIFPPGDVAALQARLWWCVEHISTVRIMEKAAAQSVAGAVLAKYIETLETWYQINHANR